MAATRQRRSAVLAGAALAGVLAGPALVVALAPAYADSTPTPIASKPPGGATSSGSSGSTSTSNGSRSSSSTSSRSTSATVTSLPRTGPSDALPYGLAGAALLVAGGALVVASRRA